MPERSLKRGPTKRMNRNSLNPRELLTAAKNKAGGVEQLADAIGCSRRYLVDMSFAPQISRKMERKLTEYIGAGGS